MPNRVSPKSQILGIVKGVALRIRRICFKEDVFRDKYKEYANYLIACGHDNQHVKNTFEKVATMTSKKYGKEEKR